MEATMEDIRQAWREQLAVAIKQLLDSGAKAKDITMERDGDEEFAPIYLFVDGIARRRVMLYLSKGPPPMAAIQVEQPEGVE